MTENLWHFGTRSFGPLNTGILLLYTLRHIHPSHLISLYILFIPFTLEFIPIDYHYSTALHYQTKITRTNITTMSKHFTTAVADPAANGTPLAVTTALLKLLLLIL